MPESTLSLTTHDLQGEIGFYLGYGRGAYFNETTWTTAQSNTVSVLMKSGLSQVYTPPPLSPGEPPHEWSFLTPEEDLTLGSGLYAIDLPGDFGGFNGPLVVTTPDSAANHFPLRVTHVGMLDQQRASQPDTTGFPRMACERVIRGTANNASTRSQLVVWPTADAAYTIRVRYKHMPSALTGSYPYPPGGAEHAELFKASVLACAELQLDDQPGPRARFFFERLAASVAVDRRRKGQFLGYNGDRNRHGTGVDRRVLWDFPPITYNGSPM